MTARDDAEDENVFHLRPRGGDDGPPLPADGPPWITFGWDEADPITFRDRAALDEFLAGSLSDAGLDVEHIRSPDGSCVLSVNGQGHLPCGEHGAS